MGLYEDAEHGALSGDRPLFGVLDTPSPENHYNAFYVT